MDDWHHLQRYAEEGDQDAFAALVRQHLGLVYGTALRVCGDPSAAEDISQSVFILLEKKADLLTPHGSLASWLYQTTLFRSRTHLKKEGRRRDMEQKAKPMNDDAAITTADPDWSEIRPLLDSAFESLREEDRSALLLRFLEEQPLKAIGESLQITEDAARMRVSRATLRLQEWFREKGITCASDALTRTIRLGVLTTVPATLFTNTVEAALIHPVALASVSSNVTSLGALKPALFAGLLIGTCIPLVSTLLSEGHDESLALINQNPSTHRPATTPSSLTALEREWQALWETHGPPHGTMKSLLTAIKAIEDPSKQDTFRAVAYTEWVHQDLPLNNLSFEDQVGIFEILLTTNVPKAAEMAANFGTFGAVYFNSLPSLRALAQKHPSGIANFIRLVKIPHLSMREQDVKSYQIRPFTWPAQPDHTRGAQIIDALLYLTAQDPAAAQRTVNELEGWHRHQALAGMITGLAEGDLTQAIDLVHALDDNDHGKRRILGALLQKWISIAPDQLLTALPALDAYPRGGHYDPELKTAIIGAYLEADWEGGLRLLYTKNKSLNTQQQRHLLSSNAINRILFERMRANPEQTLEKIKSHSPRIPVSSYGLSTTFYLGSDETLDAVWTWIKTQESSSFTTNMASNFLSAMGDRDPRQTIAWVAETPDLADNITHNSVAHTLRNYSNSDINEILAAAPEQFARQVRAELAEGRYEGLPDQVMIDLFAQTLEETEQSPEQFRSAADSLAGRLALNNPARAITWAHSQTDASLRSAATRGLVTSWMEYAPQDATEWVASLPRGPDRQSASSALTWAILRPSVEVLGPEDLGSAWSWAQETNNAEQRLRQFSTIAEKTKQLGDTQLLNEFFADPILSEDEHRKLLSIRDE